MADQSFLGKLSGSGAEARQRAAEDAKQRKEEGQRQGSIILSQKDILTGNWDAHKVLFTTLGGQARPITRDDLEAFKQNIQTAQTRFRKGITAKQVVDFSLHDDRMRASNEIRMAVPVAAHNGKVRFITNAGPDSEVSRHHVTVDFLNYGSEAASGSTNPRKAALRLRKGPLRIECDCGRWRYWYRYIATIGGFNAGRAETGFPKIRNPKLHGIACKHILRVMAEVESGPGALGFLTRLMDKAKTSDEAKAAVRTQQQTAEKLIKNQAKRTKGHEVKTSTQKRNERIAKAAANVAKQAPKPQKAKRASNVSAEDAAAALAASGLSMEQIMALIQAKKG